MVPDIIKSQGMTRSQWNKESLLGESSDVSNDQR